MVAYYTYHLLQHFKTVPLEYNYVSCTILRIKRIKELVFVTKKPCVSESG